ncbi:hypothetical protein LG634_12670 [Streptomyces bambusae]|uniref:hypothetical protein n=1 Tax=Streptomyces bambusae TaxID=1550616 RepID=UPI001CFCC218|nr:hypothetical protein [Streptomyces bambusae]MCB5165685.1 hypothetical protein [Streptomyces bambusae]
MRTVLLAARTSVVLGVMGLAAALAVPSAAAAGNVEWPAPCVCGGSVDVEWP